MEEEIIYSINCLPDEIILIILENNDSRTILNFGSTCKRFNLLVKNNQKFWKNTFKQTLPMDVYKIVGECCEGQWLNALKEYHMVKQNIYSELVKMSSLYCWNMEVSKESITFFIDIGTSNNLNYFYSIFILQNIIKIGNQNLMKFKVVKPYTMTEMYYAKIILRHFIHMFLSLKWVRSHSLQELVPEKVINFFMQWIDITELYPDEIIEDNISGIAQKVEDFLNSTSPQPALGSVKQRCAKGTISQRRVLEAITQVIYHQRHMAVTTAANLDTLCIPKVLVNKCGNIVAMAAIYQAVARKFDVNCQLIAFPNHLFLEWRDDRSRDVYTVDLSTGELQRKRTCPFSQGNGSSYSYSPDALLQYIYSIFHMSIGAIRNCNTENASYLLDFLDTNSNEYNAYRNYLPFLLERVHLPMLSVPLHLKNLRSEHLDLIKCLSKMNKTPENVNNHVTVKPHDRNVRFAVGMVCYHKKYEYVCVVRGWDAACAAAADWQRHMGVHQLRRGAHQPFYNVVAADHSERYVAEENLTAMNEPNRLYHLEDKIAREFTHFDGYAYVLNDEKKIEYPEEEAIVNTFRTKAALRGDSAVLDDQS